VQVATKQIAVVRPQLAEAAELPAAQVWLELADGSTLEAISFTAGQGKAQLALRGGTELTLPTKAIASLRFRQQETGDLANQWNQIVAARPASDVIVVRKKQALDFLEGVIGEVSADSVRFKVGDDEIPVKREKAEGLIFFAGAAELPELACTVVSPTGLKLHAQRVSYADGQVAIVSQAGLELTLPWNQIERLDFSAAKVQYVSDLEPDSVKWTPFIAQPKGETLARLGEPARNRTLEGGPLQFREQGVSVSYEKGLALRSRTELTYRLPGKFRRFKAVAFIDPAVRDAGHVRLVIHGDGRELFSEPISGTDAPREIDLPLEGVKRLKIVVDYGDDLDFADHLDLADARILR